MGYNIVANKYGSFFRRRFVAARRVLHVSSFFHHFAGFWLLAVLSFTSLVSSRHAACSERLIAVF